MELVLHINIYVFPMILLATIYFSLIRNDIRTSETRFFGNLLLSTFLLLLTELLSWVANGQSFFLANLIVWLTNIAYFLVAPFLSILWLNYILFFLRKKTLFQISAIKKFALSVPLILYFAVVISSPFTHLVFSVSEDNRYVRGSLYFLPYIITFLYMLATIIVEIMTIVNEKALLIKKRVSLLVFFTLVPVIAGIIQSTKADLWIAYPVATLAELMLYIHIQRRNITTDALTDLNNRESLDRYLSRLSVDNKAGLCLFMIDLDRFKSINDTFGHDSGDDALIQTASLLIGFFHGRNDFVARFGGDEFCVLSPCAKPAAAESTILRLEDVFADFNNSHNCQYSLIPSIGYAIFNGDSDLSKVIEEADSMMYRCKQGRRSLES